MTKKPKHIHRHKCGALTRLLGPCGPWQQAIYPLPATCAPLLIYIVLARMGGAVCTGSCMLREQPPQRSRRGMKSDVPVATPPPQKVEVQL
mmetsp:Transcript_24207/g.45713  ORF Transcript_24207/g.45713 Transcript_24207/m.45713 type:complete len:91 (-) Transcript_24207:203-475(-)